MDAAVTERAPQTASPSSSSFAAGTGSIEFGSLGELSPCWWEPEDGSAPEPWLSPDEAFERFLGWCEARGIELWDHQEEALMDLAAGDHVILGTPTGSGKSLVALGMLFMAMAQGKRAYYTAPIKALVSEKFFDLVEVFGRGEHAPAGGFELKAGVSQTIAQEIPLIRMLARVDIIEAYSFAHISF